MDMAADQLAFLKAFIDEQNTVNNPQTQQSETKQQQQSPKRQQDKQELIKHICMIVKKLIRQSDYCVFTQYDPIISLQEPISFTCINRYEHDMRQLQVDFDFNGIGVWYIAWRKDDVFCARKLLVEMKDGCFMRGMVGDFEGFWDDFAHYVTEDKWIERTLLSDSHGNIKNQLAANDDGIVK